MNWFAAAVVVLQLIAGAWYCLKDGLWLEGSLWFTYALGNIILMVLAAKRLAGR